MLLYVMVVYYFLTVLFCVLFVLFCVLLCEGMHVIYMPSCWWVSGTIVLQFGAIVNSAAVNILAHALRCSYST